MERERIGERKGYVLAAKLIQKVERLAFFSLEPDLVADNSDAGFDGRATLFRVGVLGFVTANYQILGWVVFTHAEGTQPGTCFLGLNENK